MKKLCLIFLLITCATSVFAQNVLPLDTLKGSPQATIKDIAWLAGHWKGDAFGGTIEDHWSSAPHAMMASVNFMKGDKTLFFEFCTITEEKGSLVLRIKRFTPEGVAMGEIPAFHLVKVTPNKVFFNNFTFERVGKTGIKIHLVLADKAGKREEMSVSLQTIKAP